MQRPIGGFPRGSVFTKSCLSAIRTRATATHMMSGSLKRGNRCIRTATGEQTCMPWCCCQLWPSTQAESKQRITRSGVHLVHLIWSSQASIKASLFPFNRSNNSNTHSKQYEFNVGELRAGVPGGAKWMGCKVGQRIKKGCAQGTS